MRPTKYLVLAALVVALAATDAAAFGGRCRSRSSAVCTTPVYHCHHHHCCPGPHDPAGTLIIHVPANATVTVGGGVVEQVGETRIAYVPWHPGAIEVCVEVKVTYTVPPSPMPVVKTEKVCFNHAGQTVHKDLRHQGKDMAGATPAGGDQLTLARP